MSFGMLLLAFFCSPIYFAVRRRWLAFIFHSFLYVAAIVTLPIFGLGMILWILGVAHATWDLRSIHLEHAMKRHAKLVATELASARVGQ